MSLQIMERTKTVKTYLIIGGKGGIGQAMIELILSKAKASSQQVCVFATYHRVIPDMEAANLHWLPMYIGSEQSIKAGIERIHEKSEHIDWVINCAGLLHTDQHQPEKSLRQIDADFFIKNMQINALAGLLIAKHIKPLLAKSIRSEARPAVFATISARVGSISDNKIGGWYSYRMSKAALNMGMKNLSIEWSRSLKQVCVVVMQPGTVNTQLSAPYQRGVAEGQLFSPAYSAECLLEVLSGMRASDTGSFVDWAGESIPW